MSTTLLIDVSYMSYRAFFSTGQLSHQGEATGVVFGVLRDIDLLTEQHGASRCMLAFDWGGGGHRSLLMPDYKISRRTKKRTPEEEEALEQFYAQVAKMRTKIFPALGYRNIHRCRGYEADDILAYYAERIIPPDDAVIITGDNDLWQCLRGNVRWYNPTQKRLVTFESFRDEYKLDPSQWADVKALAGCGSDDVPGITGIGDKTAAKWFRNQLKPDSKAYQSISANLDVHVRNIPLVRLPFPGLDMPELVDDELTTDKKLLVQEKLGIRPRRARQSAGFEL